jgi:uncharacterized membrane protein YdjX (TVP38/TMEM64 family)
MAGDRDENAQESNAGGPWWRQWPRIALVVLVVGAVATFYFGGLRQYAAWESLRANLDIWQEYVARRPVAAAAIYFGVYTAVTALSLPAAAAMTLVGGALFGRVIGTVVTSTAATVGATLAFLGARYLLRDWVQRRYGARLRAINEGIERDGAYYLFTLRLIPLVPFFLINLGMALTPIRLGTYVVVSWIGMLPGSFLYVNAGTAIAAIESPRDVLSPGVLASLAALGIVPLVIRKLISARGIVRGSGDTAPSHAQRKRTP